MACRNGQMVTLMKETLSTMRDQVEEKWLEQTDSAMKVSGRAMLDRVMAIYPGPISPLTRVVGELIVLRAQVPIHGQTKAIIAANGSQGKDMV